jgi:inorganic pyrophosphatase
VKISGWGDAEQARRIVTEAVKRFNDSTDKPRF